jgi:hypothetical protein
LPLLKDKIPLLYKLRLLLVEEIVLHGKLRPSTVDGPYEYFLALLTLSCPLDLRFIFLPVASSFFVLPCVFVPNAGPFFEPSNGKPKFFIGKLAHRTHSNSILDNSLVCER